MEEVKEVNYDCGKKAESYSPKDLLRNIIEMNAFLSGGIPIIANLSQESKFIHKKMNTLVNLHREISQDTSGYTAGYPVRRNDLACIPNIVAEYHFLCEEIIYHMKHLFDILIQLLYIKEPLQNR